MFGRLLPLSSHQCVVQPVGILRFLPDEYVDVVGKVLRDEEVLETVGDQIFVQIDRFLDE